MTDKTISFYCPNCERNNKRILAVLQKRGNYLCSSCGSTYISFESANKLRKDLDKESQ